MTTWATIFPGFEPDPLRGVADEYGAAAGAAAAVATATAAVHSAFSQIRSGPIDELRGSTAEAFVAVVSEVDGSLADLPPVFESLESILDHHAGQLGDLRTRANEALARAATRWHELNSARAHHDAAKGALAAINSQLDQLRAAVPSTEVDDRIEHWESKRWGQLGTVQWWGGIVSQRADELEASRNEYFGLIGCEDELVELTSIAIRQIPLHELADPSGLLSCLGDFFGGVWGWAAGVVEAIIEGAVDGLEALAQAFVALAEFLMSAAISALAVLIGVVLVVIAAIVVTALIAVVVAIGAAVVTVAALVLAALPLPLKLLVMAKVTEAIQQIQQLFAHQQSGDLGGTYDMDPVGPYDGVPYDDEAGRAVLLETLDLIGTANDDEFVVVRLDNGKYIVVLPGVTDLTHPEPGLNDGNRTVRDVDQHALPSSTSTGMDDNLYAQMVAEALARNGVPPGADVMLVGHSYGADTAVDLAADPRFNQHYHVTHVMAAAYNSGPQVPHVPSGTELLVLQNTNDMAVQVEAAGYDLVGAVDSYGDAAGRLLSGDLFGGISELGDSAVHAGGVAVDVIQLRNGQDPLSSTTTPGVSTPRPGHVVSVFDGGTAGAGHHPANYSNYLVDHTDPDVAGFEGSVGTSGYAGPGDVFVIDVSVP